LFGLPPSDPAARARVGFLPERPYFYEYLTAKEMLLLYAKLSRVDDAQTTKRIEEMLELVGLRDARDVPLRRYSKGMLQRAGLAQALIGNPELVILDEPMSGLDPVGRRQVRDLILRERHAGKTVFFSSHILSDVEAICDRVAMIHQSKVLLVGNVAELVARSAKNEADVTLKGEGVLPSSLAHFSPRPGGHQEGVVANEVLQAALRDALAAGFSIVSVTPRRGSLEDEFLAGIGDRFVADGAAEVGR
jgi:ABC-2 type transport system ATP-binding protein